jgi:hypothetical protein
MVNMQATQPQASPPPPRDKFGDFQCTKPPTFSHVVEPMNADDWLKSVKKKLQVVQCNNHETVLLASHQLSDPVADLWDAYVQAHEEPRALTSQNSELLFMHIMFPRSDQAEEERVSRPETGVQVDE